MFSVESLSSYCVDPSGGAKNTRKDECDSSYGYPVPILKDPQVVHKLTFLWTNSAKRLANAGHYVQNVHACIAQCLQVISSGQAIALFIANLRVGRHPSETS